VVYVNDRACELTGYNREWLLAGDFVDLVHPGDRDRITRRLRARLGDEYLDPEFESRILTVDGTVRGVEASDRTIPIDGESAGFLAARDVTVARRRQRELEAQNRRLEEFADLLGHDLREPLNLVAGSLQLARETGREADFARAEVGPDRMETLIADMLELSRHGAAIERIEPVVVADVAADLWNESAPSCATPQTEPATVDATPRPAPLAALDPAIERARPRRRDCHRPCRAAGRRRALRRRRRLWRPGRGARARLPPRVHRRRGRRRLGAGRRAHRHRPRLVGRAPQERGGWRPLRVFDAGLRGRDA
jgi:PAS domain S-box-containing protein